MKWVVWTADDGALWYLRPAYHDRMRPRKPEFVNLRVPGLSEGQLSRERDGVVSTLGGVTVNGKSIYAESSSVFINRVIKQQFPKPNIPLNADTVFHIVEHKEVPADHPCGIRCEFRNAWEWTGRVTVNMPKARLLKEARIIRELGAMPDGLDLESYLTPEALSAAGRT